VDHSAFDAVLASHLLSTEDDSPLIQGDFPAFLDWREARMTVEIGELTGTSASPSA
jgi:hypothetical protein